MLKEGLGTKRPLFPPLFAFGASFSKPVTVSRVRVKLYAHMIWFSFCHGTHTQKMWQSDSCSSMSSETIQYKGEF